MAKLHKITYEGLKKLEEELDYLKLTRRKEVAEKIKEAKSFGDLSENSEYDEAKNEQAIVEAKILELETMLKNVEVIDESEITTDRVAVGVKVLVYDFEENEEVEYQIVGSSESNPLEYKISDSSELGKNLVGRKVGETIEFEVMGFTNKYEIRAINK